MNLEERSKRDLLTFASRRNPVFPYDRSFEIRFDCHDRATLFFERIYIYIYNIKRKDGERERSKEWR